MPEFIDDTKRHIIPRWRPFRVAASLGELAGLAVAPPRARPNPSPGELDGLIRTWHLQRSPSAAADLIDAAIVLGISGPAREAAEWLIDRGDTSDVTLHLAQQAIGGLDSSYERDRISTPARGKERTLSSNCHLPTTAHPRPEKFSFVG